MRQSTSIASALSSTIKALTNWLSIFLYSYFILPPQSDKRPVGRPKGSKNRVTPKATIEPLPSLLSNPVLSETRQAYDYGTCVNRAYLLRLQASRPSPWQPWWYIGAGRLLHRIGSFYSKTYHFAKQKHIFWWPKPYILLSKEKGREANWALCQQPIRLCLTQWALSTGRMW